LPPFLPEAYEGIASGGRREKGAYRGHLESVLVNNFWIVALCTAAVISRSFAPLPHDSM